RYERISNSPGFRGGAIGSAMPNKFSSSPGSGLPRQRTNNVALVGRVFPSNSIDSSLNRNVANPFGAVFGSEVTNPTAFTTRGRSLRSVASRKPDVSPIRKLWSKKKPAPTSRYVEPTFDQKNSGSAPSANTTAVSNQRDAAIGKKSATTIPSAAINARPTNACRGVLIATRELVDYVIRRLTGDVLVFR